MTSESRVESLDWRYRYCGAEQRAMVQAYCELCILQLEKRMMSRLTTHNCSIRVRQVAGNPWLLMYTALCKHLRSCGDAFDISMDLNLAAWASE